MCKSATWRLTGLSMAATVAVGGHVWSQPAALFARERNTSAMLPSTGRSSGRQAA